MTAVKLYLNLWLMKTTTTQAKQIKASLKVSLKAAQRKQEQERRHGTPDSYEAATAVVGDILTKLRLYN